MGKAGGGEFFDDAMLVEYKSLKGKLVPGKPVEQIMKRLKSDVKTAQQNPASETFAKRKAEAIRIAEAVKTYKTELIESIDSELEAGEREQAKAHIDLLVATWPSLKSEWAKKRKTLGK